MLGWASPGQVAAALEAVRPKGDAYRGVIDLLQGFQATESAKRIKLAGGPGFGDSVHSHIFSELSIHVCVKLSPKV